MPFSLRMGNERKKGEGEKKEMKDRRVFT